MADGQLYSFGWHGHGRLGYMPENVPEPKLVDTFVGKTVQAIAAGGCHSLVVADGQLYSFGFGEDGQLGDGWRNSQFTPEKVDAFVEKTIQAIAAGGSHSLVVADGELFSFGCGGYGRLGHGNECSQFTPKKVDAFVGKKIQAIAAGGCHSLVLADGQLYSFGQEKTPTGLISFSINRQLNPKMVAELSDKKIEAIAAGSSHSLVVADGELFSFGWGEHGQLGHGDFATHALPKKVDAFNGKRIGLDRKYWYPTIEEFSDLNNDEKDVERGTLALLAARLWINTGSVFSCFDDIFVDGLSFLPR